MLFDTHAHLNDRAFDADREALIAQALENVEKFTVKYDDAPFM